MTRTATVALLALGAFWMLWARGAPGGGLVSAMPAPAQAGQSPSLPAPQPGLSVILGPSEAVRVLTVEQWRALRAFPEEHEYRAARTMMCESGGDPAQVGDGGQSRGAFQVQPRWWGAVPSTLPEQAQQAAAIVALHGWEPWSTKNGCEAWNR